MALYQERVSSSVAVPSAGVAPETAAVGATLRVVVGDFPGLLRLGVLAALTAAGSRVEVVEAEDARPGDVLLFDPRDSRPTAWSGAVLVALTAADARSRLRAEREGAVAVIHQAVDVELFVEELLRAVSSTPRPARAPAVAIAATTGAVGVLSGRQVEVLRLIGRGWSNNEIATELIVSINTVKTYIRGTYRVIGVSSRAQAVVWAYSNGLVDGEEGQNS